MMNATEIQQLANDMKKNMNAMLEMHNRAIASIPDSDVDPQTWLENLRKRAN